MLSFSISYWGLIKFPSFADITEREARGWKQAQRDGEERVILQITVINVQKNIGCNLMKINTFIIQFHVNRVLRIGLYKYIKNMFLSSQL
jgi:hypothetical protein